MPRASRFSSDDYVGPVLLGARVESFRSLSHSEAHLHISRRLIVAPVQSAPHRAAAPRSRITPLQPSPRHGQESKRTEILRTIHQHIIYHCHGVSPFQNINDPQRCRLYCASSVQLKHRPCRSNSFQQLGRNPLECLVSSDSMQDQVKKAVGSARWLARDSFREGVA